MMWELENETNIHYKNVSPNFFKFKYEEITVLYPFRKWYFQFFWNVMVTTPSFGKS